MTKTDYRGTFTIYPITLSNGEKSLYIEEIISEEKGMGYGSSMLQEILDYAEERGLSVCLHANANYFDEEGLDQEQLEEWYIRYGFEPVYYLDSNNGTNFFYKN